MTIMYKVLEMYLTLNINTVMQVKSDNPIRRKWMTTCEQQYIFQLLIIALFGMKILGGSEPRTHLSQLMREFLIVNGLIIYFQ